MNMVEQEDSIYELEEKRKGMSFNFKKGDMSIENFKKYREIKLLDMEIENEKNKLKAFQESIDIL